MSTFYQDIATPVFLSAFFSWFIAQLLKAIIGIFRASTKSHRGFLRRFFWATGRSEEHTSELQSHSFISYAVFCLKKKKTHTTPHSAPYSAGTLPI